MKIDGLLYSLRSEATTWGPVDGSSGKGIDHVSLPCEAHRGTKRNQKRLASLNEPSLRGQRGSLLSIIFFSWRTASAPPDSRKMPSTCEAGGGMGEGMSTHGMPWRVEELLRYLVTSFYVLNDTVDYNRNAQLRLLLL